MFLIEVIDNELTVINRMIQFYQKKDTEPLEGSLFVQTKGKHKYYVVKLCKNQVRSNRCLGVQTDPEVIKFKSRRFRAKILEFLEMNRSTLTDVKTRLKPLEINSINAALPKAYEEIPLKIHDVFPDDAILKKLKKWAQEPYPRNGAPFDEKEIYADDGRRVRSRGECNFYNELLASGIPFRYDAVMEFTDEFGRTVTKCPDFIIMCCDGSLILIEHLGRFDSPSYREDFKTRSHLYFLNGYTLGKNYFVTCDDKNQGYDSQAIKYLVEHVKYLFYESRSRVPTCNLF